MNSCWEIALSVVVSGIIIILAITRAVTYILMKILPQYKIKVSGLTFTEMMTSLNTIIENEIALYERSVFEGGGKLGSSSQFENYYNDIVNRILGDLSDEFFERMSVYMTKEAVVAFICRLIKAYLAEKVA